MKKVRLKENAYSAPISLMETYFWTSSTSLLPQNWFQVIFKNDEIIAPNYDNPQVAKRRGVTSSKKATTAATTNTEGNQYTHHRNVSLKGTEISLRWQPSISVEERFLVFTVDYATLKKHMKQCNQKSEASLTVCRITANGVTDKYVFAIGDGQEEEGCNDMPVTLTEMCSELEDPYPDESVAYDTFLDLSVSKVSALLTKMFDKDTDIVLDLYQGDEGNGIYFHTPDFSKKKPFGVVEGEGVEHVDRFTMSHKLLESLFKSSLAKTTMAHFVWSPGFPLKIWMYLGNWGSFSVLLYPKDN